MKDGEWRVFPLSKSDAKRAGGDEVMRVHLMEHAFGVSFGFVEQRVKINKGIEDTVSFYIFCSDAKIGTDRTKGHEPVPSLRHGMEIIEWLWHEHKGKEKP